MLPGVCLRFPNYLAGFTVVHLLSNLLLKNICKALILKVATHLILIRIGVCPGLDLLPPRVRVLSLKQNYVLKLITYLNHSVAEYCLEDWRRKEGERRKQNDEPGCNQD